MSDVRRTNKDAVEKRSEVRQERDPLKDAGRVFNYLDEHPGVGVIAGGALTASGIGAIVYYGSKLM